MRAGLRTILSSAEDIEVVGEADDEDKDFSSRLDALLGRDKEILDRLAQ